MSAAVLMEAWGDTMLTTAILVGAVLMIRKPFMRRFGPRLTYALWTIPALRFVLPPLPFADPVAAPMTAAPAIPEGEIVIAMTTAHHGAAASDVIPGASLAFADALPLLFLAWLAGALAILARAMLAHRRFKSEVLTRGVDLEPLGGIRLVMSGAVDGPVAFGLVRRFVAVPRDFFARYAPEERALAIDHELAHHRHGDLWANAAALVLLASQWFNPLAWRAIRAFRFDQEAACDARVLVMAEGQARGPRTASYATAIAKAAVGSRLALAAPMASQDNLQERLTMLTQQNISRRRTLAGRLLVGGAAIAALAATATLVPTATAQSGDLPVPPAPPAPPEAVTPPPPPAPPVPPEAIEGAQHMLIISSEEDGEGGKADGERRQRTRVVVRGEGEGMEGEIDSPAPGRFAFRMPGGLTRDDILSTLKEQGVTGAQAEAIADKLEAKRHAGLRTAMAPLPPMPPIPPMPTVDWKRGDGRAMAFAHCGPGQTPVPLVDRGDSDGKKRSRVLMVRCGDAADLSGQLSALRKARDRFAQGGAPDHMSAETRAKIIADMDRAIADLEREKE
ncbi:M56 family metallopeptidase [Sphingopyxis flava]|uniref:Signal transducer regulating beta-lactamase production, contains metallopeptidase domain n=1 Tax=Sphingopyxis flava TaxID=1507287 RepID=A0A1T5A0Q5_9SPHN|nr:M56 family metallopeptidase [Sphingopyxis flava]SKB28445.1 Signal transducer regulating beta-lactamase production, contains metallopeptidase domain [Sphingopyxis flava]